ncbi:MAG: hypothetical protein WC099_02675 [Candidatus Paceibacterota bacterium]
MFTSFIARKILESQLKNIPADQREKIISAFEKDPELFKKIASEIEAEVKSGTNQMTAAARVAEKYKTEVQALMSHGENK